MHIQFTKIRYKNILSVGNQFIDINFEDAKTTLISGKNGAGKCVRGSTEIEILFDDDNIRKKFEEFVK